MQYTVSSPSGALGAAPSGLCLYIAYNTRSHAISITYSPMHGPIVISRAIVFTFNPSSSRVVFFVSQKFLKWCHFHYYLLKALLQAQMSSKKSETLDSYHWDPGAPAKAG